MSEPVKTQDLSCGHSQGEWVEHVHDRTRCYVGGGMTENAPLACAQQGYCHACRRTQAEVAAAALAQREADAKICFDYQFEGPQSAQAYEGETAAELEQRIRNASLVTGTDELERLLRQREAEARLEEARDWLVVVQACKGQHSRCIKEGKSRVAQLELEAAASKELDDEAKK